jgi:hypothetical protein
MNGTGRRCGLASSYFGSICGLNEGEDEHSPIIDIIML